MSGVVVAALTVVVLSVGASPAHADRADECRSEGYLIVGVEGSGDVNYLSYRANDAGGLALTTDSAEALRVGHEFGEGGRDFTILDSRAGFTALAAIVPPSGDAAMRSGTADYLVLGATSQAVRQPSRTHTTMPGGEALAASSVFWFDFSDLGPYLDWPGGDSAFRTYDSYLDDNQSLVWVADPETYRTTHGGLTRSGLWFERAEYGVRCPGTAAVVYPVFEADPAQFPPTVGEVVTIQVGVAVGDRWGTVTAGTADVYACGPTIRPQRCDPADGVLVGSASIEARPSATADLEFTPSSGGAYCFTIVYRGIGRDDASDDSLASCVDVEGSLTAIPTPRPSPTSTPVGADPSTTDGSWSVAPLVITGLVILGAAGAGTALIVRARRRRNATPGADSTSSD